VIDMHHGGPSGHSASLLVALAEKGLGYESRLVDLAAFRQHCEQFLAINPAGQLPVIDHDGRRLTETFFILLYLDERFPSPALGGSTPQARYAVQKWGKYVETHIAPNLAILAWAKRGRLPAEAAAGLERLTPERRALWQQAAQGFATDEVEAAQAALVKAAERIAADLADAPWLAGENYSLADIAVFPHAARLAGLGIAVPDAVPEWLGRIAARPVVREALGEAGLIEVATMGPERGRWG
jgi:glutathione S-transferase